MPPVAEDIEDAPASGSSADFRKSIANIVKSVNEDASVPIARAEDDARRQEILNRLNPSQQAAIVRGDEIGEDDLKGLNESERSILRVKVKAKAKPADATPVENKQPDKSEPATEKPVIEIKDGSETGPWTKENAKKWLSNRKAEQEKALADIAERDKTIAELQAKAKETEGKVSTELPADVKAEIEQLKAENKAYSDRLMELEITEHPKFKSYFQGKSDAALARAKKLVGDEKAVAIEKIIKLPDSEYKDEQIEAFLGDIESERTKIRLGVVLEEIDAINSEKQAEITKAHEHRDTLNGERLAKGETLKKANETAFAKAVQEIQDAKNGLAPFQLQDGNPEWNKAVAARVEKAKQILMGGAKAEEIQKAVFRGLALAPFLATYDKHMKEWQAEKATLEKALADYKGAAPTNGQQTHENAVPDSKVKLKPGMTPSQVMSEAARAAIASFND